ncbi:MAG: histone deacetylase [Parashewanella sp.]
MIPLVYHSSYSKLALPDNHRFPKTKYEDLYHYLLTQKIAKPAQFFEPKSLTQADLARVHCPQYVNHLLSGTLPEKAMRRIGFPWSHGLIERTLHSVSGTALTAELSIKHGIALHLSGGYHHAHYNFGSGFCLFNDLYFAAKQSLLDNDINSVLIFDCDVHQGDGTATLARNDDNIITCSLHCGANFPARKAASDYDIELEKGTTTPSYLETIEQTLNYLIRLHQPDLILYDAGVDIHQDDDLGYLNICDSGIYQRDKLVFTIAQNNNTPIAAVIGGGYSRSRQSLTQRHSQMFSAALTL